MNKVWTNEFKPDDPQFIQTTLDDVQTNVTETKNITSLTSEDALTIMEYQTVLEDKLNFIISQINLLNGVTNMIYTQSPHSVQIRANARLISAGRKIVEDCPLEQQKDICVVLIQTHNWELVAIPVIYQEEVKLELGL